jgi:V/A-type H+-transporting ATPase subunit I
MLIGDAGYGVFFLGIIVIARLVVKKAPWEFFALMTVTSLVTIGWGSITGTWFGSEEISNLWFLKWMRIDEIYSFAKGSTTELLMFICFILGITHLTIARLRSFIQKMPSLIAFAELGWLSILWGMFFLVLMIVLGQEMNPAALPLIIAGFGFLIIFSEQKGKFFRGLLSGLLNLPLNILSAIGSFSDIVSYVRLYAVGLASLELAKAFNGMAGGVGFSGPAIIGSVLILFLGHALNIILGAMGVIVHGVRLNMLEFSGHLGMEWSGKQYKPFTVKEDNG